MTIRLIVLLGLLCLIAGPAFAQTVLQVPYDAAQIVWAAPAVIRPP